MPTETRTWTERLRREPLMFWLFVVCWTVVHLKFEWNFWLTDARDVFGKYEPAASPAETLAVAKEVYYTKATWMFALVWMVVLGMRFRAAVAWSFALYCVELLLFFPIRVYTVLNALLATGMVIELFVRKRLGLTDDGPAARAWRAAGRVLLFSRASGSTRSTDGAMRCSKRAS